MKEHDTDRREGEHNHQTSGLITEMKQQILIETDHCFLLALPNKVQMAKKQSLGSNQLSHPQCHGSVQIM